MTTIGPTEAYHKRLQALREEIERKTGKTPEQLYEEREKRARDAIELKEPDRVPVWIAPDPVKFSGLPRSAAYYDPVAWKEAVRDVILYFEPDLSMNVMGGSSGLAYEALDVKNRKWPGGPLPPDQEFQFIEGEYMKEDEYDIFLSDISDFVIRYYLPRVYGALLPFTKLPPLSSMYAGFEGITTFLASPEFEQLAKSLSKAAKEIINHRKTTGDFHEEMALLGFPYFDEFGGVGGSPFDTLSSTFRGMKGTAIDMFRRPEKLLQACDMILEQRIKMAVPADPQKRGNPKRVAVPLWRGDKGFMSEQQFKRFYWPGLKKALLASIELGYVPIVGFEAHYGDRLEYLLEIPRGKMAALINHVDVIQAKEILKDHVCVISTAPLSLKLASLQEAEDYYKNLIKVCGKGGGFILHTLFPENATKEGLKAMVDSIKEYGRY
jgi:hypothetical protein